MNINSAVAMRMIHGRPFTPDTEEDPAALAFVFERFLTRSNMHFKRVKSKTSPSIYFKVKPGPGEVIVRISNHDESGYKPAKEMADFNVKSSKALLEVQKLLDRANRTHGGEVFRYKVNLAKRDR